MISAALALLALAASPAPHNHAPVARTAARTAPQEAEPEVTIEVVHAGGNVHMLVGRGGNVAVSIGPDGPFVVDDQFAELTAKLQAAIATLVPEGTPADVRFVVNTHWHGDHTGGNGNLRAAGAVVVAHASSRERMTAPQFSSFFGRTRAKSPVENLPVVTFAQELAVHWNGDVVRAIHVPHAHTDGDALILFEEANVLHTGDVFLNGGYPFVDVDSGGSIQGLIAGCDRALALCDEETAVIPGHGKLASKDDLRAFRAMLAEAVELVRPHVEAGRSADEAVAARPTATLDERWGKGFIPSDAFVRFVHHGLTQGER